jgi:hypothetical protein
MRKLAIVTAGLLLVLAVACTKETTSTDATVGDTTTVATTTHTETTTYPAVDTTATAEAKQDVKDAANTTTATVNDAARSAEHSTGTAMEKAGKKLQKNAKTH